MDEKAVNLINKACELIGRNDGKALKEIFTDAQNKNLDLSVVKGKHKNAFLQKLSYFFKYLFVPGGMAYFEYDESRKEYIKKKKELKEEIRDFIENNTEDIKANEFLSIFMKKI